MKPDEFLALAAKDPLAAAEHADQAAQNLKEFAQGLRAQTTQQKDLFTGGFSDRVRAQVIGPDGQVKQTIDTGAQ